MTRFSVIFSVALLLAWGPGISVLPAQQVDTSAVRLLLEQRLGRSVSQDEIVQRLRESGMSRTEARSRLRQLGYDPAAADFYFDQMEQGGAAQEDAAFLEALGAAGLTRAGTAGTPAEPAPDSAPAAEQAAADSVQEPVAEGELPYFGLSLFQRESTEFKPLTRGPVGPDYRLGPGDELVLVLTGDVQQVYQVTVAREGFILIPDVGQIFVNGLSLAELENRLYDRLGRVYSGVRRGPEATTRFQISLGTLRTNQVYLIGEVQRPGAYEVSAVATVFNALYHAGGPTENGSFRRIQVRRGGTVVQEVDLYEYLLRGDSRSDIRLQNGDIVFVPLAENRVAVRGAVRRPAIYEAKEEDGLRDVLAFAGGLQPDAFVERIQIDRILPPEERRPGIDRVLVDVDVQELLDTEGTFIPVKGGDDVEIFVVSEARRHRVTIEGEVHRPGTYEWQESTTLWDVIERAQGLDEQAYTPRAHIYRLNEDDGSRRLIRTPLLAGADGQPVRDVLLEDRDSVVVFSREALRNPARVIIDGYVKNPGSYALAEGMTLKDLILTAGGFSEGANVLQADVARLPEGLMRTDTTAYVVQVRLSGAGAEEPATAGAGAGAPFAFEGAERPDPADIPLWQPAADEFTLRHGDRVFIRRAPGYQAPRTVMVTGEVITPGAYVLETRQERLLDVLERSGGLTDAAYVPGLQVVRDGNLVATDLARAREEPESRFNLVLQAGDSIHMPALDPTVVVTGAVNFESRVLFRPGAGLDYYIGQAGGYSDVANEDGVTVTYQNGEREDVDGFLLVFSSKPEPMPGSTIYVPAKPPSLDGGTGFDDILARTTGIVTALLTLILAGNQINEAIN